MRFLILLSALCCLACPSLAAIVQFQFSGVIDQVFESNNEFGGAIHPGDPFVTVFTFDTNTPDSFPADPAHGGYEGIGLATITMPGFSAAGTQGLTVWNPNPVYNIDVLLFNAIGLQVDWLVRLDGPIDVLGTDALPTEISSQFTNILFSGGSPGPQTGFFTGHMTSIVVTPEPGSLLLMACILFLLVRRKGLLRCAVR